MVLGENLILITVLFLVTVGVLIAVVRALQRRFFFDRLEKDLQGLGLSRNAIVELVDNYIEPTCFDTLSNPERAADEKPVARAIDLLDQFFFKKHAEHHCFVFAGPGQGKTAFLVNYVAENLRRMNRRRINTCVIGMDTSRAFLRIKQVEDKQNKVLFLDAYQEDELQDMDREKRLIELMEMCKDFLRVVVFCREEVIEKSYDIEPDDDRVIVYRNVLDHIEYGFNIVRLNQLSPQEVLAYQNRYKRLYKDENKGEDRFGRFTRYVERIIPQLTYYFSLNFTPHFYTHKVSPARPLDLLDPITDRQVHSALDGEKVEVQAILRGVAVEAFKTIPAPRRRIPV